MSEQSEAPPAAAQSVPSLRNESYGLKNGVLSPLEVLGQSVANIAPTATPTVVIPLVFAVAGAGTWFAYLFALVAVLLVSFSINQFARRSASPGSIYTYIATGLGPTWGIAVGWTLFIAYIACASSVTTGFTNYANVLAKDVFSLPDDLSPGVLVAILGASVLGSWFVAYRDVRLSTRLMLGLELVSIAFILLIVGATLFRHGLHLDWSQLSLQGTTADTIRLGLILAIFSFTGFESSTSLGSEARAPLRSIPRAVSLSAVLVGLLFSISAYTQVLGFLRQRGSARQERCAASGPVGAGRYPVPRDTHHRGCDIQLLRLRPREHHGRGEGLVPAGAARRLSLIARRGSQH